MARCSLWSLDLGRDQQLPISYAYAYFFTYYICYDLVLTYYAQHYAHVKDFCA